MLLQFVQFKLNDLQRLNSAFLIACLRRAEVGCNFPFSFSDCFGQEANVLMGIFNAVKRSLQAMVQGG